MGILAIKTGRGMSNDQMIDWLRVRVKDKEKGAFTEREVPYIINEIADLREPMSDFVFYLYNQIGKLRGEFEPNVFVAIFEKVKQMIDDYTKHPEMYKF